jgi:hypothetical protein
MKKIKYILAIILSITVTAGTYRYYNKPTVEPSPIDLIMQEPAFQAGMRIQAENLHLDRQKAIIEKRKEELRREELNLASTTKQSSL